MPPFKEHVTLSSDQLVSVVHKQVVIDDPGLDSLYSQQVYLRERSNSCLVFYKGLKSTNQVTDLERIGVCHHYVVFTAPSIQSFCVVPFFTVHKTIVGHTEQQRIEELSGQLPQVLLQEFPGMLVCCPAFSSLEELQAPSNDRPTMVTAITFLLLPLHSDKVIYNSLKGGHCYAQGFVDVVDYGDIFTVNGFGLFLWKDPDQTTIGFFKDGHPQDKFHCLFTPTGDGYNIQSIWAKNDETVWVNAINDDPFVAYDNGTFTFTCALSDERKPCGHVRTLNNRLVYSEGRLSKSVKRNGMFMSYENVPVISSPPIYNRLGVQAPTEKIRNQIVYYKEGLVTESSRIIEK